MSDGFINISVTGQSEVLRRLKRSQLDISEIMSNAAVQMEEIISEEIKDVFRLAASSAGEGFPDIYEEHLLETIESNPIAEIEPSFNGIDIALDFDKLGTYQDFAEAFHYQARLAGGGRVEFPYGGEELKEPNTDKRYLYWLSKADHDEAYAERVYYWESLGLAPEWLLLNYGQGEFAPTVRAFPIVETIQKNVTLAFRAVLSEEADNSLEEIWEEEYIPIGDTGLVAIRGPKGRFMGSRRE